MTNIEKTTSRRNKFDEKIPIFDNDDAGSMNQACKYEQFNGCT